jgi:hypothetical protein
MNNPSPNFNLDPFQVAQTPANFSSASNKTDLSTENYTTMGNTNMNACESDCTICAGKGYYVDTNLNRQICRRRIGTYSQPSNEEILDNTNIHPNHGQRKF